MASMRSTKNGKLSSKGKKKKKGKALFVSTSGYDLVECCQTTVLLSDIKIACLRWSVTKNS